MATTAAAASPAGTAGGPASNASSPAPGRPQLKTTSSSASNVGRRTIHSPIDNNQRRNSSQKAWTTNNPPKFTQNGIQSPSNMGGPQPANKQRATESDTQDKHLHDRMKYLFVNLVGRNVVVTTKDGAQFSGFLATVSSTGDLGCALKMATRIKPPGPPDAKASENTPVGGTEEKTIVFKAEDVVHIVASKVTFGDVDAGKAQSNGSGFRTDADISASANYNSRGERELRRWEPSHDDNVNLSLEDSGSSAGWDQFAVNEKLFGVKTNFDENIYTTKLDKNHPLYSQREARAAKIAREIETSGGAISAHVAEERGLAYDDSGMDEEDKYSGVQRPQQQFSNSGANQNRYTPPARRQAQTSSNVSGVDTDPAIISSQRAPNQPSPLSATPVTASDASTTKPAVAPATAAAPPPAASASTTTAPAAAPATAATAVKPAVSAAPTTQAAAPKSAAIDSAKTKSIADSLGLKPIPALKSANTAIASGAGTQPQLISHFRQFVSSEKERVEKRLKDHHRMKRDKDDKMNELRKFAKDFKLNTPVPQDLIPILAKDKAKQAQIVEKSKAAVAAAANSQQETKPAAAKAAGPSTTAAPAATQTPTAGTAQHNVPGQFPDRQQFRSQGKNVYSIPQPDYGNKNNLPYNQRHQGPPLGHRLQGIQQHRQAGQHRFGGHMQPMRGPMQQDHLQNAPTGPSGGIPPKAVSPTPSAAARMNAKAMEFRPNPNAISFTPTFNTSSVGNANVPPIHPYAQQQQQFQQPHQQPHHQHQPPHQPQHQPHMPHHHAQHHAIAQQHQSRAASPSAFFGTKKIKPASERPSINDFFNPFKKDNKQPEPEKDKRFEGKSGLAPPFLTQPLWPTLEANKEKKYVENFDKQDWAPNTMVPPHMQHSQSQQGHHVPSGPHGHPHQGPQMGIPQQFDQDHMRHQHAGGPPVGPPPMSGAAIPPYGSPAGPHVHMYQGYVGGPGAPPFRYSYAGQFTQPGGPGVHMMPGQPPMPYGPQMNPPFVAQIAYSPSQVPAIPFQGGPPPPPSSTGYPSPRRPAAPMMMHTNSTQGQPPPPQMVPMTFAPGAQQPMMHGGYPPPQYQYNPNHQGPHYGPNGRGPHPYHGQQGPSGMHGHQAPPMAVSQSQQPPDTSSAPVDESK